MVRLRMVVPAVLVALLVAAAGCAKQPPEVAVNDQVPADARTEAAAAATEGGGGGDGTARFVAVDIAFESAPEELTAGTVTVELVNNGQAQHNVVFDDLGEEPVVQANGGETATGEVELEPGTYRYHCSVPGHEPTMNGEVEVTE